MKIFVDMYGHSLTPIDASHVPTLKHYVVVVGTGYAWKWAVQVH